MRPKRDSGFRAQPRSVERTFDISRERKGREPEPTADRTNPAATLAVPRREKAVRRFSALP
jgi:hypothetical protein